MAVSLFRTDTATFCVAIYFTPGAITVVFWTMTCACLIIESERIEAMYVFGAFTFTCVLVKDSWRVTFDVRGAVTLAGFGIKVLPVGTFLMP